MPSVEASSIPKGDDLKLLRGDTWSIAFQRVGDISGRDKLWFALKDGLEDTDATALVRIEETVGLEYIDGAAAETPGNGAITVTDAVVGSGTVGLAAVESAKLEDTGNLFYDIQMFDDPTVTTLVRGRAVIVGDVARITS